jgi:hypothetical protein
MKFSFAGVVATACVCVAICSGAAQTAPSPTPAQEPAAPATQPEVQVNRQVIFSRSIDADGQTTTQSAQTAAQPAIQIAAAPSAEDAERQALTFTALDLDVRLRTAGQHIAVRALVTVRNDGKTPLLRIPLQISSTLDWERIRIGGKDATFSAATLNSDADHTGQLHEATVLLTEPLAPGSSLPLDVTYSGVIAPSAQRLLAIGTPEELALASDWDQIGVPFTGLRGFGNVVWYPVASVPIILGDGARLFDAIGEHKLRLTGARFRLRLTAEFPHGQAPTVALINGRPAALTVTEPNDLDQAQEVASVATASLDSTILGFEAPSLFVAIRNPHPGADLTAWTFPEDDSAAQPWTAAEARVTPFLQGWLGQRPRSQLTLLDLPGPHDAPFEAGSLLAASLRPANPQDSPDHLDGILVHALTHAWLANPSSPLASAQSISSPQPIPPPAWLDEGVAGFMGTLWIEKQLGRDQALGSLEASRAALALAEPESPGQSSGQPLAAAISPVFYRTKAAYVLWMLRDLAGDQALGAALRAYAQAADAAQLAEPRTFERLIEHAIWERIEKHDATAPSLAWFFSDWVDADKGLPDLSIAGVFPSATSAGNWLVAVNVANSGYAAAEVPVTVRSDSASVTQRLLVPARGKAIQRILIQGQPTEVQANDGTVPETQASMHITKLNNAAGSSSSSSQPGLP